MVLGPVLFLIYINDLVNGLECPALLFADDAKVFTALKSHEDIKSMERDLRRLEEWSRKWLIKFNIEKCITLHVGYRNPKFEYEMNGIKISSQEVVKDLGVYVS